MELGLRRRHFTAGARSLAFLFAFSFVSFRLGSWDSVPAAHGQLNLLRVIVLDFETEGGLDPVLGRKAADALVVEMTAAGGYEVLPRDQIIQQVKAQGLSFPLDALSQVKIADELEANGVITGKVYSAHVSTKPPRAKVEIAVSQTDVVSGEPVNGARTVGDTGEKFGQVDPAVLLDEALTKAAYGAVKSMEATRLPKGIVQILDDKGEITINIGARDGVVVGMRMAVTRDEWMADKQKLITRRIGEILISGVEPAHSTARALPGSLGIQTSDRIVAIFETPVVAVAPGRTQVPVREKPKSVVGVALAPLLGLVLFIGGAGSNPTSEAVSGITAQAGQVGSDGSTVVVRWSIPGILDPKSIAGHMIHRSTSPGFVPSMTNVIDFTDKTATRYVDDERDFDDNITVDVEQDTGVVTIQHDVAYNPSRSVDPRQQGGGLTLDIEAVHSPLIPGVTFYYAATRVVAQQPGIAPPEGGGTGGGGNFSIGTKSIQAKRPRQDQGGGQTYELVLSYPSNATGGATPLDKVPLLSPPPLPNPGSDSVNLDNVTFTFQTVDGGDEYQLQVSNNVIFPVTQTFQSPEIVATGLPGGTLQTYTPPEGLIAATLGLTGASVQLFWRVGARNIRDPLRPTSVGSTNDEGSVWSSAFSFRTAEGPPPPPSSVGKNRLGNLKQLKRHLTPEQWEALRGKAGTLTPAELLRLEELLKEKMRSRKSK